MLLPAITKGLHICQDIIEKVVVYRDPVEDKLISSFNAFMTQKQLNILFEAIHISKTEYIEVGFKIADLDYSSVISKGYPTIREKLKGNSKYEKLLEVMSKVDNYSDKLIQSV